jgi:hypothetical protein
MVSRAKQRRPQVQTIDELVARYDSLLKQVGKVNGRLFSEKALREEMAEVQREILSRQRKRNQRDLNCGREWDTMCNTPLPPYVVRSVKSTVDLDSVR